MVLPVVLLFCAACTEGECPGDDGVALAVASEDTKVAIGIGVRHRGLSLKYPMVTGSVVPAGIERSRKQGRRFFRLLLLFPTVDRLSMVMVFGDHVDPPFDFSASSFDCVGPIRL